MVGEMLVGIAATVLFKLSSDTQGRHKGRELHSLNLELYILLGSLNLQQGGFLTVST